MQPLLNLAELSLHAYPGINPCLGGGFMGFAHKSPPQNNQSYMHPQSSMLCIEDWVAPWLYGLWLCHIMAEP